MADEERIMAEGKAQWLLEGGIEQLSEEERALLLALVSLEADIGRELSEEEQKALDQILEKSGSGGQEITRAVRHLVEAKARKDKGLDWSALKGRIPKEE